MLVFVPLQALKEVKKLLVDMEGVASRTGDGSMEGDSGRNVVVDGSLVTGFTRQNALRSRERPKERDRSYIQVVRRKIGSVRHSLLRR